MKTYMANNLFHYFLWDKILEYQTLSILFEKAFYDQFIFYRINFFCCRKFIYQIF